MISAFLCLMAAGVCLAQSASDPAQVTLRWLRLGGLIALPLLAFAMATSFLTGQQNPNILAWLIVGASLVLAQLVTAQLGWRRTQRALAAAAFAALVAGLVLGVSSHEASTPQTPVTTMSQGSVWEENAESGESLTLALALSMPLSAGLLGGFLMTMLLGHAYLTAGGEMTQRPFLRLVVVLGVLLVLRASVSLVVGLVPWWKGNDASAMERMWTSVMLIARYGVGLVAPGVFTWMTYDCVRRRANQSATGILYVASVLVVVGEGIALALVSMVGRVF